MLTFPTPSDAENTKTARNATSLLLSVDTTVPDPPAPAVADQPYILQLDVVLVGEPATAANVSPARTGVPIVTEPLSDVTPSATITSPADQVIEPDVSVVLESDGLDS